MNSALELVPAKRTGATFPGGASKSERHFLDFLIDGESLWEKVGRPRDTVSVICFEFSHEETVKAINRLLLIESPVIPGDRGSLFICSECGDFGCGAVTALIAREGDLVIWKKFGFENNYEEDLRLAEYAHIGPYSFDWRQYERVLTKAMEGLKRAPLSP